VSEVPQLPEELLAWMDSLVRSRDIPALLGVRPATAKGWRNQALHGVGGQMALPDPVRLPSSLARLVDQPLYDREELLRWGRHTGRLDRCNRPSRAGPGVR